MAKEWWVSYPSTKRFRPGRRKQFPSRKTAVAEAKWYSKKYPSHGYVDVMKGGITIVTCLHGNCWRY
jgi:hypothetical protein